MFAACSMKLYTADFICLNGFLGEINYGLQKIGVAGPVGSGKTALIEAVTREMASSYSIGVITNDIYTKEDAEFLAKNSVMPRDRITGVETGGCPHTCYP